jgi:dihydrofolate reductase
MQPQARRVTSTVASRLPAVADLCFCTKHRVRRLWLSGSERFGQDILMFGSATLVESLMDKDLIDEYRLLVHPIIVGSGKRAFREGMATKLRLVKTKTFSLGVTLLCYQPANT